MLNKITLFLFIIFICLIYFWSSNYKERQILYTAEVSLSDGNYGTGVWINENHLITAKHVVLTSTDNIVSVRNSRGLDIRGKIIYQDPNIDLAIIQTEENKANATPSLSCELPKEFGLEVNTVGSYNYLPYMFTPLHTSLNKNNVNEYVSKLIKNNLGENYLILSGTIHEGNSGGGIFARDTLIGIIIAYPTTYKEGNDGGPQKINAVYGVSTVEICRILRDNKIKFSEVYSLNSLYKIRKIFFG